MDREFKKGDYVEVINTRTKGSSHLIGKRFHVVGTCLSKCKVNCVISPFRSTIPENKHPNAFFDFRHIKLVEDDIDEEFKVFMNRMDLTDFPIGQFIEEGALDEGVSKQERNLLV